MSAAIGNGVVHGTHVFNAMPRFDYRNPGGLEALLEDDRVSLELIPDCFDLPHVHPASIRLLKRMVGADRICTVTDAVAPSGLPDGSYRLGDLAIRKIGDLVVLEEPWLARGERSLAGSVLAMDAAVRNLVRLCGFTLEEAVQTATINPARALGLQARKGSLSTGKDADIAVLDPGSLAVQATYVRGTKVFDRG
jgi:N-acetylglucosamine-6-phosphate deacetylase